MGWLRLLAAPVLVLTVAAAAGAAAPKPSPSPTPAPSKPKRTASHKSNGTIEAYDAEAHTLTVRDSKGNATVYVLASDVKVWVGPHSVAADVFASKNGTRATLKYKEIEGVRTASQVRLPAPSTKPRTP